MKISSFGRLTALAATACLASACVKVPGVPGAGLPGMPGSQPAGPAASNGQQPVGPPAYETKMIPGSGSQNPLIVRVNISTGATVTASGAPSQMTAIPDPPIPAGHYRLLTWSQPETSDGTVTWGVARVEDVSGRVWMMNGCGSSPCTWIEITPPAK